MSTYNYMACEECKTRTKEIIVVQRVGGTNIDNKEVLLHFLIKHRNHNLQFFSEHDDERYAYACEPFVAEDEA